MSEPAAILHVTFVCSGNICRSPMAEKMFAHQIDERGLADRVRVSSGGTADWHSGSGADDRAIRVLRERGYPAEHRAARVGPDHLDADLVVALGRNHFEILKGWGVPPERLRMLRKAQDERVFWAQDPVHSKLVTCVATPVDAVDLCQHHGCPQRYRVEEHQCYDAPNPAKPG